MEILKFLPDSRPNIEWLTVQDEIILPVLLYFLTTLFQTLPQDCKMQFLKGCPEAFHSLPELPSPQPLAQPLLLVASPVAQFSVGRCLTSFLYVLMTVLDENGVQWDVDIFFPLKFPLIMFPTTDQNILPLLVCWSGRPKDPPLSTRLSRMNHVESLQKLKHAWTNLRVLYWFSFNWHSFPVRATSFLQLAHSEHFF